MTDPLTEYIVTREDRQAVLDELIAQTDADFIEFLKYVKTEDQDDEGRIREFPWDWGYVREVVDELLSPEPVLVIPKSRRMMMTTILCCYVLWRMLRTHVPDLYMACVISINEAKAKLFGYRMRDIYKRLPDWRKRPWEQYSSLAYKFKGGGGVHLLNAGGDGPRSEGYTDGIMDECAFQLNAVENYGALRQCARKVIETSSVNGRGNHFDSMMDHKDIRVFPLHYSKHPHRQPGTPEGDAWLQRAKLGQTKADWDREQEMDRDVYATEGYYSRDFNRAVVAPVDWDGENRLMIGMDYSYRNAAAMLLYHNEHGQVCRLREWLIHDVPLDEFCLTVFNDVLYDYLQRLAPHGWEHPLIAPDPWRGNQHHNSSVTDADIIRRVAQQVFGKATVSMMRTKDMKRREGHRAVRSSLILREDHRYGTIVDPSCTLFIQGLSGAYGPKEKANANQIDLEEPDPTRIQVHVMDADRYAVNEFMYESSVPRPVAKPQQKKRERRVDPFVASMGQGFGDREHVLSDDGVRFNY